jgi:protein-S-isoprenylcysteine O-methyltransferase Ste14
MKPFVGAIRGKLAAMIASHRLWCSLYISGYKNSQLITSGPYSLCRNPLYFFSFVGFAALCARCPTSARWSSNTARRS